MVPTREPTAAPPPVIAATAPPATSCGDRPINSLPTFVRSAYDQYRSKSQLPDYYARYKALESVYATTIKHVGTSFALIAADYDRDFRDAVWSEIFRSSSLGGWLAACDLVCSRSGDLSDDVRDYCDDHNTYRKHPSRKKLDQIAVHFSVVVEELARHGYNVKQPKSLNLLRALEYAVVVRNCCAHGALDLHFFDRVEADLVKALKLILLLIPFSKFVFWGRFGGNAVRFVEWPPTLLPRSREDYFWVESSLLGTGFAANIPFLLYRQDSRTVYFLNDTVTAEAPTAQFIDYGSGRVLYRELSGDWLVPRRQPLRPTVFVRRPGYVNTLSRIGLNWREVSLATAKVDAALDEVGIYMFVAIVNIGGRAVELVLYVGKTTNLRDRLTSYLRIKKGYDSRRQSIVDMFNAYGDVAKFLFAPVPAEQLGKVERAIYEVTAPEFNEVAPPED